ncbi:hypothetical protein PQQ51_02615 [Paraburkholderia xenovorans]|uniref:hypothetical protein n=1 Tax=Paraburkholderia xenovorans TaxID=36873 RepID=UPI0038BD746C
MAVALILSAGMCVAQNQTAPLSTKDFFGKWIVTDVVGYTNISAGIPEARRILGKVLTITPNWMEFDKSRCTPNGGYTISEVDSATKLREFFDLSLLDAGLPPRTTLLETNNCYAAFSVDPYRVLFSWNGVIVRAYRQK